MSVKNKTNKNYKRSQKGRSMVEMLGVLAIVGVLSVGGVYGYGVAMKKHKANELLHQASMQASSIAAQIASGKTDLALENFGNSSNGSFSSVKGPDGSTTYQKGDDKFTMQITGMDEVVCKQMQGMKGGTVRSVSCGTPDANAKVTATLAFNKDLSSTPVASDYNGDPDGCEASDRKYCDNDTCIPATEECPTGGSSGSSCKSGVVKVYNCETKTTIDCCPDTETCEQPVCTCNGDDDCPSPQECDGDGVCACPWNSSGVPGEFKNGVCCDGTLAWDAHNWLYRLLNIEACGCPNGGVQSKTVSGVCCKDGTAWVDDYYGYAAANIEACGGCPRSGEEKKGVCCDNNNFAWIYDENDGYGHYGFFGVNLEACGCPNGGVQSKTVSGVCCKWGKAWDNDFRGYDSLNIEACGCPDEGTEAETAPGVCCKDGYAWGGYDYNQVNSACSPCPGDDWYLSSGVCCNGWGLAWDGDDYTQMNISACGCPYDRDANSGTESDDGTTCCFEGKAWNGSDFLYNLDSASCS